MTSIIRGVGQALVSGDKFRLRDGIYDLDLTYVNDRIIAMGVPGQGIERNWRNDIDMVSSFLNSRHAFKYLIFNLTGESYDYTKFYNRVEDFGFPDHHPPPMVLYWKAVESIAQWLLKENDRVAVIHCLAGRSRTGTIVCGYLLLSGVCKTAAEAIQFFNIRRSEKAKNVVLPSQIRYINYFEQTLRDESLRNRIQLNPSIRLESIVFRTVPDIEKGTFTPKIQIVDLSKSTEKNPKILRAFTLRTIGSNQTNVEIPIQYNISGDIEIIISHKATNLSDYMKSLSLLHSKSTRLKLSTGYPYLVLFRYSFNTAFITPGMRTVKVNELDAPFAGPLVINDIFPQDFQLTFQFEDPNYNSKDYNDISSVFVPPTEVIGMPLIHSGSVSYSNVSSIYYSPTITPPVQSSTLQNYPNPYTEVYQPYPNNGYPQMSSNLQSSYHIPNSNLQPISPVPTSNSQSTYSVPNSNLQPIFSVPNNNPQPIYHVPNNNPQPICPVPNNNPQPIYHAPNTNLQPLYPIPNINPRPTYAVPNLNSQTSYPVTDIKPQPNYSIPNINPQPNYPFANFQQPNSIIPKINPLSISPIPNTIPSYTNHWDRNNSNSVYPLSFSYPHSTDPSSVPMNNPILPPDYSNSPHSIIKLGK